VYIFSLVLGVLSQTSESSWVHRDWYSRMEYQLELCREIQFSSSICPEISPREASFPPPSGGLTPYSFFLAKTAYASGEAPRSWLHSLNLEKSSLRSALEREAYWLLAQVEFDEGNYIESSRAYDRLLPYFRGRSVFHQQRAWLQYRMGQGDAALGSVLSAQSPLIYSIPFARKYLIRALVERDQCRYDEAMETIRAARSDLSRQSLEVLRTVPWVDVCHETRSGDPLCRRLEVWARNQLESDQNAVLKALDYLEIELKDNADEASIASKPRASAIVWPFVGEAWQDELGRYRVNLSSKC